MGVRIERPGGVPACVVHVDGDMDAAVVPEMRNLLDTAIASSCPVVVLDLSQVTYADSSALGLIVWLDARLDPLGGRLVLAGADRNVNRILELSGLVGLAPTIAIAPDARQAVASVAVPPALQEPTWVERLSVPAAVEHMGEVRRRVCELIVPLGLSESALFDLKVAVGEALANAVRHGSPAGAGDRVDITVTAYPDRVVVGVRDSGVGFDGASPSGDDVYASGGRGVMFMRALMDRVDFERCEDGGTLVRLTKHLPDGHSPMAFGT